MSAFTCLPDLVLRSLGGAVLSASDELFAEKENLIKPEPAVALQALGHKGGLFDGWETRRRRAPGHDFAIIRLGMPGIVRGVVIDTAHFTGNYPESALVEAASIEGYPSADELASSAIEWIPITTRLRLVGDSRNEFAVDDGRRFTHLKLNIYPDGGVARFRVHGEPIPDVRFLRGVPLDLVALELGGRVVDCSDKFYTSPEALLMPGTPRHMEGWETRRRRGSGNDWVEIRLAEQGRIRQVEVDTSYNVGNAPGACRVRVIDEATADRDDPAAWHELLPRTPLQPDTRHRFLIPVGSPPATSLRLDIYPDGGLARFRAYGELTERGGRALAARWFNSLPVRHAEAVLAGAGLAADVSADMLERRPYAVSEGQGENSACADVLRALDAVT
jgi:allantoicase